MDECADDMVTSPAVANITSDLCDYDMCDDSPPSTMTDARPHKKYSFKLNDKVGLI